MATLKDVLRQKLPVMRDDIKRLVKDHGEKVICEVTVSQAYGGMRDIKSQVCDTSDVSPEVGLIIRGVPRMPADGLGYSQQHYRARFVGRDFSQGP